VLRLIAVASMSQAPDSNSGCGGAQYAPRQSQLDSRVLPDPGAGPDGCESLPAGFRRPLRGPGGRLGGRRRGVGLFN